MTSALGYCWSMIFSENRYPTFRDHALNPAEVGRPLGVERLDALAEILRRAQPAVAMALQLDRDRERAILGVVEELLGGALGERREAAQFVDQRVGRDLELIVGHALGGDAPVARLPAGDALRAHHHVLGAGNADDFLQPCRSGRAGNL